MISSNGHIKLCLKLLSHSSKVQTAKHTYCKCVTHSFLKWQIEPTTEQAWIKQLLSTLELEIY